MKHDKLNNTNDWSVALENREEKQEKHQNNNSCLFGFHRNKFMKVISVFTVCVMVSEII